MKKRMIPALLLASSLMFGAVLLPSDVSPSAVVEAAEDRLPAPVGIKAKSAPTSVTLMWDKVDGADYYRVYQYDIKTRQYELYKAVKRTECTVTGLESGKTCYFSIAAVKIDGDRAIAGEKSKVGRTCTKKVPAIPEYSDYGFYDSNALTDDNIEFFVVSKELESADDCKALTDKYLDALRDKGFTLKSISTVGSTVVDNGLYVYTAYEVKYKGDTVGMISDGYVEMTEGGYAAVLTYFHADDWD